MYVSVEFGSYNPRRCSKPWVFKVIDWKTGEQPEVEWGSYLGNDDGGVVEIDAQPGDVVRYGQKDNRNPKHTVRRWAIVGDAGELKDSDAVEAKRHWRYRRETAVAAEANRNVNPEPAVVVGKFVFRANSDGTYAADVILGDEELVATTDPQSTINKTVEAARQAFNIWRECRMR